MLYREIIAVCSEIHTRHINTAVWAERTTFNVKPGGMQSDHWALDSSTKYTNYLQPTALYFNSKFYETVLQNNP